MRKHFVFFILTSILGCSSLPLLAQSTFVVDRLTDTGEGSGLRGDLRYCITQANQLPGDDTITFTVTGTINLTSALPNLSTNIDIQGPGSDLLTVRRDTGGFYRIFMVSTNATVSVSGLTISNGSEGEGGGIYNSGTLTITHSAVSSSSASKGGGIYNFGTLRITDSYVSSSSAYVDGGGIYSSG